MKKLGFGLMRLPMNSGNIDLDQMKKMVDMFIERGFTYFDTAWMYCDFKSQSAAKEALVILILILHIDKVYMQMPRLWHGCRNLRFRQN